MANRYISYLRVSTKRQGASGLGEDAQRATVAAMLAANQGQLLGEYAEVESAAVKRKGHAQARPKLLAALDHCRQSGATLVVAKLDRLSREAEFVLQLSRADVPILFCDLPGLSTMEPVAGRLILTFFAGIAEWEAGTIRLRTREALAAAKRRGQKLGGYRERAAAKLTPAVRQLAAKRLARSNVTRTLAHYQPVIGRIQQLHTLALNPGEIADVLNQEGFMGRFGRPYTHRMVRSALECWRKGKLRT